MLLAAAQEVSLTTAPLISPPSPPHYPQHAQHTKQVSDVGLVADGPAAVEELLKKLYDGDDGGGAASVVDGDEDGGPAGFHGELSFTRVSDLKLD